MKPPIRFRLKVDFEFLLLFHKSLIVKAENVVQATTHNIVAWGKTAEIVENYLVKGKQVAIEGKLAHRFYETKEGEKRHFTEIKCNELLMLGK